MGIGYAGQVNDVSTGLSYQQQRYYDPLLGRFITADPVVTDLNSGGNFNRYWYGNNSPYRYRDPDGRFANFVWGALVGIGVEAVFQIANGEFKPAGLVTAAGVGAVTAGVGSFATALASRGAATTGQAVFATATSAAAAAGIGKNVEAAAAGQPVSTGEVALSMGAAAVGATIGGKLATSGIASAERLAASKSNVHAGMGKATLGAIREGGATAAVRVGATETAQKGADVATGLAGKQVEEKLKP